MSKTEKLAEVVGATLAVVTVSLVVGLIGSMALTLMVGGLHGWIAAVPEIQFVESLSVVFGSMALVLLVGGLVKVVAD